jgi:hypothetical protein
MTVFDVFEKIEQRTRVDKTLDDTRSVQDTGSSSDQV